MTDTYMRLANGRWTSELFKLLNLPRPTPLQRYGADKNTTPLHLLIGTSKDTGLFSHILPIFSQHLIHYPNEIDTFPDLNPVFKQTPINASSISLKSDKIKFDGLIFDATSISSSCDLKYLYDFFHPVVKNLTKCGRIIIIAREVSSVIDVPASTAQRAIEGFTRSLAKEVGRNGCTCQLLRIKDNVESQLIAPIEFLLSKKSAYISAQSLTISAVKAAHFFKPLPLAGKKALVTGASRGIGKAIAETLTRDGAKVICLDIPEQKQSLEKLAHALQGQAVCLDITLENAPEILADILSKTESEINGLDIIVHNAGVTMDKTLAKMAPFQWNKLMQINLTAIEDINSCLLNKRVLNRQGRIICVSSMSGIAGNFGQTNYATSKAAIIGYVEAMSEVLAKNEITINAVAPGFIATKMTQAMPFIGRQVGQRMNSLQQSGAPIDVAEAIVFFASPQAACMTGNVLRVCGQSLIGA